MPNVYPIATSATAPTVSIGDAIFVDMNGGGAQILSSIVGTPDPSKVSISLQRSGFNTSKVPTSYTETFSALGVLRNPYPDQATPMQLVPNRFILVSSDQIYSDDTVQAINLGANYLPGSPAQSIANPTRLDTLAYSSPVATIINPPMERIGSGGLYVEVTGGSEFARNGQQFAAVDIWVEDSLGNVGPITTISSMSRSQYTPSSGYVTPQDTPAYVYGGTIFATGLTSGQGNIYFKVYPWVGPVFNSKTDLPVATTPHLNQPSDGYRCCIDLTNVHTEVYAWVNQDGSSGLSAAVQTSSADPGATSSYGTPAAAATALKTYNITRGHNDLSGGVIMLRDVAGSTAGANAGSYSTRGTPFTSTVAFPPGLTPLKIRAASGVTSQLCRWRGIQANGTAITLGNKGVASRVRWENVYFDSVGLTGTDHTAVYTSGLGLPTTQPTEAAAITQIFIACKEVGDPAITTAPVRYACGFVYEYGLSSLDPGASNAPNQYHLSNAFSGLVITAGSSYSRTTGIGTLSPRTMLGCYIRGVYLDTQAFANSNIPLIKNLVWSFFEQHINSPTRAMIRIAVGSPVLGMWLSQYIICGTNTTTSPCGQYGADGMKFTISNLIAEYGTIAGQRLNWMYNDQGYYSYNKQALVRMHSAITVNNKRDTFDAPETAATSNDGTWSAARNYYSGQILGLAGLYYQALQDVPAGTILTNATYWYAIPTPTTKFGPQPRRLGAMRFACGVNSYNNVFGGTTQSDVGPGPSSWYGEFFWPGSVYGTAPTYVNDTSNSGSNTAAADGNFIPTGVQIGLVSGAKQTLPYDLRGQARLTDGTGAAGALEHA
jgi:hypothetical protein